MREYAPTIAKVGWDILSEEPRRRVNRWPCRIFWFVTGCIVGGAPTWSAWL